MLVSVCESVCVGVCVSVCVLVGVCVCVVERGRGTGSRNGVEGRGLELRVEGWRMRELVSEYVVTRRRYTSYMINT